MQIIVGLGNPGNEYKNNRHNAGFLALDFLRGSHFPDATSPKIESKFEALVSEAKTAGGGKILFAYPQTFMNDSGRAVKKIVDFYKLSPMDILIIHDEIDLPFGSVKQVIAAGDAGHNGVKSIIAELGTKNFRRIRIGVESREEKTQIPTDVFVLQDFSGEEQAQLNKIFEAVAQKVTIVS